MSQDAVRDLAVNGRVLGREALMVALYLLSELDYENEVFVSKTEISEHLKIERANLARAFRKLMEKGFIREGRKVGNMKAYVLNPEVAWRGTGHNHIIALDKYRKDH